MNVERVWVEHMLARWVLAVLFVRVFVKVLKVEQMLTLLGWVKHMLERWVVVFVVLQNVPERWVGCCWTLRPFAFCCDGMEHFA